MDRGRLYFGSKEETVFWIPLVPELRHVLSNCGRDMAAAADTRDNIGYFGSEIPGILVY